MAIKVPYTTVAASKSFALASMHLKYLFQSLGKKHVVVVLLKSKNN
jgi:hypothetical protein